MKRITDFLKNPTIKAQTTVWFVFLFIIVSTVWAADGWETTIGTELSTLALDDIILIQDVSDTTDGDEGTTKYITITNLFTDPTFTGEIGIGSINVSETELGMLEGATPSTAELNYVDGVTSAIQTQMNTKAPIADPTFTGEIGIGAVNISETELGIIEGATLSTIELNYVDGVTSAIQTQIDTKLSLTGGSMTGTIDSTIPTTTAGGEIGINAQITHATNALTGELIGVRGNARVNAIDSAAGTVIGGKFQAGNMAVGSNLNVATGVYVDVVNKIPSGATTWTWARGYEASMDLDQGSSGNANTITNAAMFYGVYNLPTVATYSTVTNGYGIYVKNEAVGGTGQMLDAAFYATDASHSGGIYGWDYGLDFSGIASGAFGTADIRGVNGETIDNNTNGTWDFSTAIVEAGSFTAGGVEVYDTTQSNAAYEGKLINEAGLYSALSDVTKFWEDGDLIPVNDMTDADGASTINWGTYGHAWTFGTAGFLSFRYDATDRIDIANNSDVPTLSLHGAALLKTGTTTMTDEGIRAQTSTGAGDWFGFDAYDVDGTAYVPVVKPVAGNVPHVILGLTALETEIISYTTEGDMTNVKNIGFLSGDDDSDNDVLDLQDGTVDGQVLLLFAYSGVDANDTISIAYTDTACVNCPAIVFDKTGENAMLIWSADAAGWGVFGLQDSY